MILKNSNSEKTLKAYLREFLNNKKNPRKVFDKVFEIVFKLSKETKYAVKDIHNVLSTVKIEKTGKSFDSAILFYFKEEIKKRLA